MLLPDGEWDSTGRFLPGTEDCKWRLGLFGYRPLPCVTCIAHAAIGVPYTPVGSCQTRSTRSFGSAAEGYVPGRCCPNRATASGQCAKGPTALIRSLGSVGLAVLPLPTGPLVNSSG